MSNLDTVMGLNDDAMSNQYEIFFPEGIPGGGNSEEVSLRMDQALDIPQSVFAMYEFYFRGTKIVKTSRLEETDKTLSTAVRVDQKFNIWDSLRAWELLGFNAKDSTAAPDLTTRTTLGVRILDGNNNTVKTFYFRYVKLKGLKLTSLDPATGDPLRAELEMIFGEMDDGNG